MLDKEIIKGDQRLRYNIEKCKIKVSFEILYNISENSP